MQYKVIGPAPKALIEGELDKWGRQGWHSLHFVALPLKPGETDYSATWFVAVVEKEEGA